MDVVAVDEDGSLVGGVESLEEGYDGCFPAAGWADEGDELAAFDFDVEVREERGVLAGVAECDVGEFDVGSGAGAEGLGLGFDDLGFLLFGFVWA